MKYTIKYTFILDYLNDEFDKDDNIENAKQFIPAKLEEFKNELVENIKYRPNNTINETVYLLSKTKNNAEIKETQISKNKILC